MDHPKAIGDRTTLAIMLALHALDVPTSVPFGENTRYDLIIERGRRLLRVQCKTGRLRAGAVRFNTCSFYGHHPNPKPYRDYIGEIDAFAVYCLETGVVYLIPIEDVALRRQGALRVTAPRNNQRRRIRFASDYEIARVMITTRPVPRAPAGAGRSSA